MGLPNAGKTTYLAALWHTLNNSHGYNNKLKLHKIGSQAKYLSHLSKKWADANPLERTARGKEEKDISIEVADDKENIFTLRFPDLSGESFQSQYAKREISNDLVEYIKKSNGILVFINVNDIDQVEHISNINDEQSSINDDIKVTKQGNIIRQPEQHDPMQIQIIELLQFIETICERKNYKLGIILSAWDIVRNIGLEKKPEEFIKERMNMLWQFLFTSRTYTTSFWGVSAQGGELKDEALLYVEPIERIIVVNAEGEESHDITLPIFKVLGENNAE
jgi:hypothetical protein